MTKQDLCNSFYDMANVVTIKIFMPQNDWDALKNEYPAGGICNFSYIGDRFSWHVATSIEISGTAFPSGGPYAFNNAGVSKKSYCGSFSTTKPSLRIDISKYLPSNENAVENLIGTHYITLNNCIQDPSYIRQPLGYSLFKQAGLPFSRCNFAHLYVNNVYYGVYLNIEPIKKRHIQNNFNNNDNGNLYEIEVGEDFTPQTMLNDTISFEGFSPYTNKLDLKLATTQLTNNGVSGMSSVINTGQFLKYFAMEVLLKHWDGYSDNLNNTYIYNDVVAVSNPTIANVDFKFIPWGLDQILQPARNFQVDDDSVLGSMVRNDPASLANLKTEIRNYINTIFDRDNYNLTLIPFINQMYNVLTSMGVAGIATEIDTVKLQLKLVKSGGFQIISEFPLDSSLLLDRATEDCIHTSNTEFIGAVGGNQEVYHYPPNGSQPDRWYILPSTQVAGAFIFRNRAYASFLHASAGVYTQGGNLNVYCFRTDPRIGNDFEVELVDYVNKWEVSGYFKIKSTRTSMYVFLSATDLTPKGRKQVHQISNPASATVFYLF